MGSLSDGAGGRDLPVLLGAALTTAVIVLIINLIVDLSYSYFDPKVRAG